MYSNVKIEFNKLNHCPMAVAAFAAAKAEKAYIDAESPPISYSPLSAVTSLAANFLLY